MPRDCGHRAAKERSVCPDVISFNSAMAALKRAGEWEKTLHLMQLMDSESIPLRTSTYVRVLVVCRLSLVSSSFLFSSLKRQLTLFTGPQVMSIDACGKANLWHLAVGMIDEMHARSLPPDDSWRALAGHRVHLANDQIAAQASLDSPRPGLLLPRRDQRL